MNIDIRPRGGSEVRSESRAEGLRRRRLILEAETAWEIPPHACTQVPKFIILCLGGQRSTFHQHHPQDLRISLSCTLCKEPQLQSTRCAFSSTCCSEWTWEAGLKVGLTTNLLPYQQTSPSIDNLKIPLHHGVQPRSSLRYVGYRRRR